MPRLRTTRRFTKKQDVPIEAEAEPGEVESDEDQAPFSAKEAPTCCLLLHLYFVRSYRDTCIVQSDTGKISSGIRKNRHARAKRIDMRDLI